MKQSINTNHAEINYHTSNNLFNAPYNCRLLWKTVNNIIYNKKNINHSEISALINNNKVNFLELSDILNNHFTTVGL